MEVIDNIDAGKYVNRVPFDIPALVIDGATTTIARAAEMRDEHKKAIRRQRDLFRIEEARMNELFRDDLEIEFDVVGHPKADRLFEISWSDGHSDGLQAVAYRYEKMADLLTTAEGATS